MNRNVMITIAGIAILSVVIIAISPSIMPLAIGGIDSVDCYTEWVRVKQSWVKTIGAIDSRTFSHDENDLLACPAWLFLRDNQESPELVQIQVCGITVTQYYKVYNHYHTMYGRWYTTVDWKDATAGNAFVDYMASRGYSHDTHCTAEVKIIFDGRECLSDGECPVDEWVGEPYCGL